MFEGLTDDQFGKILVVQEILVLVREESPGRRELRGAIFDYLPDTRPRVVYSAIDDAIRRKMIDQTNGHLDITPKGIAFIR